VSGGANMMTYTVHSQSCRIGSCAGARSPSASRSQAQASELLSCCPGCRPSFSPRAWRASCVAMGWLVLLGIAPLALFVKKGPAEVGQNPDGDRVSPEATGKRHTAAIADPTWAATEWTLGRAARTARF